MFSCAKVLILYPFVFRSSVCPPLIFPFTSWPCYRTLFWWIICSICLNFCRVVLNPWKFLCVDYNFMEFSVMVKTPLIMMKHFYSVVISAPNTNSIFHFIVGFLFVHLWQCKGLLSSPNFLLPLYILRKFCTEELKAETLVEQFWTKSFSCS